MIAARVACDIGNSRIKWGLLDPSGRVVRTAATESDQPDSWAGLARDWGLDDRSEWAISSVNPPRSAELAALLSSLGVRRVRWFRSAADVPIAHVLPRPDLAGADRALAVLAALAIAPDDGPGLVILCGTAVTVERVSAGGTWAGGAIGMGLGLAARSLHRSTAMLPEITPRPSPPAWGVDTRSALDAGLFWGTVGGVRELIARQDEAGSPDRWRVWTGGDAPTIAPAIEDRPDRHPIVPDLVLMGLALVAFGAEG